MKAMSRRGFVEAVSASAAMLGLGVRPAAAGIAADAKPALLGGEPVRCRPFPSWPVTADNDEKAVLEVLRKGKWNRLDGGNVRRFEEAWAKMLGAKHCVATANGTSALFASLNALDIGPGDEVIVPPYTFVATINVVLLQHALPVFVDTDPETSQIDARKVEAAITKRTRCILPVHLGGSAADLDTILAVAAKRGLPVLEDACQSHLAEWRKQKVSTLGALGCFSFQASKNLNCGEGGAILTNDAALAEFCASFHNQGRAAPNSGFAYARNGSNLRLTEFQGAILLEQLTRLEKQSQVREKNAEYLAGQLREIPGIRPARMYEGCTRNAWHLFMLRYDTTAFAGLPRSRFLKAMHAEGIPCSGGYAPLNKEPFLKNTLESRAFRAIYPPKVVRDYFERIECPANDRLCQEAVWLTQTMLLGSREDMDQIADAVRKTQRHAAALAKT